MDKAGQQLRSRPIESDFEQICSGGAPILVTGSHRSGTTFVGKILAHSKGVLYLWEPFQAGLKSKNRPGKGVFDYWFEYLDPDREYDRVSTFLRNYAKLHSSDFLNVKSRRIAEITFQLKIIWKKLFNQAGLIKQRFLLKDPIAFFSAEWLCKHLSSLKVIVMVRNPISFIRSLQSLGWDIDLAEITQQETLMKLLPRKTRYDITRCADNPDVDIIDKGIAFWNLVYGRALEYRVNKPDWLFIRLEELAENPSIMGSIFKYCELQLPSSMNRLMDSAYHDAQSYLRNFSQRNGILSVSERNRIESSTRDTARDWGYAYLGGEYSLI